MEFLKGTKEDVCVLKLNDYGKITRYLDPVFGVHNNRKSHTGAVMKLGKGSFQ
jgi:hypothetical protein